MPFDMANLRPEHTGLPIVVHMFKNTDFRARHGPRIKAYPGKPHEGRETIVTVPTQFNDAAHVVGRSTLSGRDTKRLLKFVALNWMPLSLFWYSPDFDEHDVIEALQR